MGLIFLLWGTDLFPCFPITRFHDIKSHVNETVSRDKWVMTVQKF